MADVSSPPDALRGAQKDAAEDGSTREGTDHGGGGREYRRGHRPRWGAEVQERVQTTMLGGNTGESIDHNRGRSMRESTDHD